MAAKKLPVRESPKTRSEVFAAAMARVPETGARFFELAELLCSAAAREGSREIPAACADVVRAWARKAGADRGAFYAARESLFAAYEALACADDALSGPDARASARALVERASALEGMARAERSYLAAALVVLATAEGRAGLDTREAFARAERHGDEAGLSGVLALARVRALVELGRDDEALALARASERYVVLPHRWQLRDLAQRCVATGRGETLLALGSSRMFAANPLRGAEPASGATWFTERPSWSLPDAAYAAGDDGALLALLERAGPVARRDGSARLALRALYDGRAELARSIVRNWALAPEGAPTDAGPGLAAHLARVGLREEARAALSREPSGSGRAVALFALGDYAEAERAWRGLEHASLRHAITLLHMARLGPAVATPSFLDRELAALEHCEQPKVPAMLYATRALLAQRRNDVASATKLRKAARGAVGHGPAEHGDAGSIFVSLMALEAEWGLVAEARETLRKLKSRYRTTSFLREGALWPVIEASVLAGDYTSAIAVAEELAPDACVSALVDVLAMTAPSP